MAVLPQPTDPNCAVVKKVSYRRSKWFLRMGFLVITTAFSVGVCNGEEPEMKLGVECKADESKKVWEKSEFTLSHFEVGGVNLALYKQEAEQIKVSPESDPFELYEDFNIADQITGEENWADLITYRRLLERPSLSFYVDKVARKRWLPTMGISQPHVFALKYTHELTDSGKSKDERRAIMKLLPSKADYAAKPTHMLSTNGVWLVKHNTEDGITHFSNTAKEMTGDEAFDARLLAKGVSKFLHQKANADLSKDDPESWVLRNVKPGIVIEQLFTDVENEDIPPLEFNIFTVWGKVWVAQMNVVDEDDEDDDRVFERFYEGYVHRNGSMLIDHSDPNYELSDTVPDWLDYAELVRIAENLGAHKDMFRTDIFVGVPAGVLKAGATKEERMAAVQIVVSESEIYPTTTFPDENICEEGARLWIAGYKMGNHRIIPNTEVPAAFLETGFCALSACDAKEGQAF
jgi:hypothetical protein